MRRTTNPVWFENSVEINCNYSDIEKSLGNFGEHYKRITSQMPGMSKVQLVEQGSDFVTIITNEGLMKRTNISLVAEENKMIVEFDEEYKAGATITAKSHFTEVFTFVEDRIVFQLTISNLRTTGFLGFFYRQFASKNIGNAFLLAYNKCFA